MNLPLFISYASDDQAVALQVCALLEGQGVPCWIAPRDVAPGNQTVADGVRSISGQDNVKRSQGDKESSPKSVDLHWGVDRQSPNPQSIIQSPIARFAMGRKK